MRRVRVGAEVRVLHSPDLSPSPTPFAVEVDGGYLYVAGGANSRIVKYTTDGDHVTEWGSYGTGDGGPVRCSPRVRELLGVDPSVERPTRALSLRAAPSPFRGVTAFTFTLTQAGAVGLDVVDVTGRRVRHFLTSRVEAGEQRVPWDGRDDRGARLPAGVYLARIRAGNATAVVRLLRMH
jgi:flagellar hook capping protein FlgD